MSDAGKALMEMLADFAARDHGDWLSGYYGAVAVVVVVAAVESLLPLRVWMSICWICRWPGGSCCLAKRRGCCCRSSPCYSGYCYSRLWSCVWGRKPAS